MRVNANIKVDDRWSRYQKELQAQVAISLAEAARVGASAARAKPSRYSIDRIKGANRVDIPVRDSRGWHIDILWTDFRSRFFDKGTYQKLGRVLSARSREGSGGNRGVKPQRFTALARRTARLALIEALNRRLR